MGRCRVPCAHVMMIGQARMYAYRTPPWLSISQRLIDLGQGMEMHPVEIAYGAKWDDGRCACGRDASTAASTCEVGPGPHQSSWMLIRKGRFRFRYNLDSSIIAHLYGSLRQMLYPEQTLDHILNLR